MIKWRPEGWKPGFSKEWDETRYQDFENGAAAMMEALRTQGVHRDNEPFDAPRNTGAWVFIPDDEQEG